MAFTSDKKVKDFLENYTDEYRGWQVVKDDDLFDEITWQNTLRAPKGELWVVLVRERLYVYGGWYGNETKQAKYGMPEFFVYPSSEAETVPMRTHQCRITEAIKRIRDNHLEVEQ